MITILVNIIYNKIIKILKNLAQDQVSGENFFVRVKTWHNIITFCQKV